ncbi:MAG: twin-arginine translocation signal domain-containing protein [Calditrichaeota bacterium]|nr:MAG: twin-arginine translocation signal domain-containing protein [Calditrichota bacterium]
MNRRNFLKLVGAGLTAVAISPSCVRKVLYTPVGEGPMFHPYEIVQLVDAQGNPIRAGKLKKEQNYVFNYPYISTPCILINLPEPAVGEVRLRSEDGEEYLWRNGAGKEGTVVAYSGICAHQLSYIRKDVSFLRYVPRSGNTTAFSRGGVIVCAAHNSVYDPAVGAKNLAGEAQQPLAAIVLEHRGDDTLWAVGVLGPELFHRFFKEFRKELRKQFGDTQAARAPVTGTTVVVPMEEYSQAILDL